MVSALVVTHVSCPGGHTCVPALFPTWLSGAVLSFYNIPRSVRPSLVQVLAERAAWRIGQEQGLDVVSICPNFVMGPATSAAESSGGSISVGFMKVGVLLSHAWRAMVQAHGNLAPSS